MGPETTPASPANEGTQALPDLANALQGNINGLMLGNAAVTLLVALVWHGTAAPAVVWTWAAVQLLNCAVNVWAARRAGGRPASARSAPRRLRAATLASAISGTLWGVGVLLLWPPERLDLQMLLIFMMVGLTSAALHSLHAWIPAFHAFFTPCAVAVIGATAWQGGTLNYVFALATAVHFVTSSRFAHALNRTLVDSLRTRHALATLAADLRLQKELAEEASLDKSRFLAAASHDLRQPVHALSLFIEALAQQPLGAEAQRLLGHVRRSAEAMGGMFNALLDMSRLDAGMVRVEPRAFALLPMLERIADDEGSVAREKGLALRLNAQPLTVRSDPTQVERVLRNLAANAVRHTDRGGVLVTARRRAGEAVIRVIDTGIGIAPEHQAEVFKEFVQLRNPERDRSRGLGLGLAIVQRLTMLLQAPLAMRSRPGRGTSFTLRLPLADVADAPVPALDAMQPVPEPVQEPGQGALALLVDDDAAIRLGMATLLERWGWEVVSAAGIDDLLPQLLEHPGVPGLILCDFRLRGDETGLDVIARVQSEYNEDIPAMLITGDTAPERLREAHASGHVLLHKPIAPAQLREEIARLMAAAASP